MATLRKLLSLLLCFSFIFEQSVFAQVAQTLDISSYFNQARNAVIPQDKFRPLHLRYISYDSQSNDFKLLLDKGDTNFDNQTANELTSSPANELNNATQELLNYFFIGLALPNEGFWVNLRPDTPDNIIDDDLAKTDIGRILLEADVQLKKDTAGLTSPQSPEGKEYWDKLYKRAGELFGTENITIPTLTRPWIVPNEIIIREAPDNAYIYKATLKVMLEEDYLTEHTPAVWAPHLGGVEEVYRFSDHRLKQLNEYSTQLIRELIIPKLTYQVNTAKRYASLRQVYYSLILAQWFKARYRSQLTGDRVQGTDKSNNYLNLIDSGNLANLTAREPYDKQIYFQQYQKSFQDGEYNLTEPVYTPQGQSIRQYMSGGVNLNDIAISSSLAGGGNRDFLKQAREYILPATWSNNLINFNIAQVSSPIKSIRKITDDPFGIERKEYLKYVHRGKLSESLASLIHSFSWPVDMLDINNHIANFDGVTTIMQISDNNDDIHDGIDIQVEAGREVSAVEGGVVVRTYVNPLLKHLIDIWVYSKESGLLWKYGHLDKKSVPNNIPLGTYFDLYSDMKVEAGKSIGKVGMWPKEVNIPMRIKIPKLIEKFYKRRFHHLHLEVRHVGDRPFDGMTVHRFSSVNPLQLLKPLYDVPETSFAAAEKEKQSFSSLGVALQELGAFEPRRFSDFVSSDFPATTEILEAGNAEGIASINPRGIVLVHVHKSVPHDGILHPNSYYKDGTLLLRSPREIVEFSWNGSIDYDYINWKDGDVVVLVPLKNTPTNNFLNLWYAATSYFGAFNIPPGSLVLVREGVNLNNGVIQHFLERKIGIIRFPQEQGTNEAVNTVLLKSGYVPMTIKSDNPWETGDTATWIDKRIGIDYGSYGYINKENHFSQLESFTRGLAEKLKIPSNPFFSGGSTSYDLGKVTISMESINEQLKKYGTWKHWNSDLPSFNISSEKAYNALSQEQRQSDAGRRFLAMTKLCSKFVELNKMLNNLVKDPAYFLLSMLQSQNETLKQERIRESISQINATYGLVLFPEDLQNLEDFLGIVQLLVERDFPGIFDVFASEKSNAKKKLDSSSPVDSQGEDKVKISATPVGGIDFHALPIQTESVVSSALSPFPGAKAFQGDLDVEWAQIQQVFKAGIRPSVQRLVEFSVACASSPAESRRKEDVIGLIADLLRREEEDKKLILTDLTLKGLLSALET
ncbi:MAG: hypothetical protein A2Y00_09455 [Omnitrophica WOR_2 bacterium GWF2_43_52]|nr:MAG: hypothetical protein A2062_00325 [Omnitrophica WOR_2 bacterium GWA2_44_7]OGX21053.1 MAG: hypothetical protein A2Y00_09455 [Omnitrophica WOR_2 bacterium GWF2_43_52]HAH20277.1 hypothetical protein [Candidatus Omnitrophota bacterium]HBG64323.1 hypothetical protein [Candidatus Omnitrophota bacterium]